MVKISYKNQRRYKSLTGFLNNLHHINDPSFNYSLEELAEKMEQSGLVDGNLWGHYITSRRYIFQGIVIETLKGVVKVVFEYDKNKGGYNINVSKLNSKVSKK